jgi:uncharacterized protein YeaO (DUF488 family)
LTSDPGRHLPLALAATPTPAGARQSSGTQTCPTFSSGREVGPGLGVAGRHRGREMKPVRVKRVYDAPSSDDGVRVLVDRLWPRGVKRDSAKIDLWLKQVAPSDGLRRWFGHDPGRWAEFEKRYRAELAKNAQNLAGLRDLLKAGKPLTLLYAAKDTEHNNAIVLRNFLLR